jgi:RHS repeat-associated protein
LSGDTFTTNNRYVIEGNSYYSPLISASIGGANRYYLYDALGSARQLLNDAQTTTDTYTYEAFGNLMGSTGTTANPYKYVGSLGYYQTGSSLMHLGARYYMPELGRFVQRDPGRRELHSYVYARNKPGNRVDPNGRFSEMPEPAKKKPEDPNEKPCDTWNREKKQSDDDDPALVAICLACCGQRFSECVLHKNICKPWKWPGCWAWYGACQSTCWATGGKGGPDVPTP